MVLQQNMSVDEDIRSAPGPILMPFASCLPVPHSGAAFADLPDVKPFVKPQGGFLVGKPPGGEDAKAVADKVRDHHHHLACGL